jgi:hypothetical protein
MAEEIQKNSNCKVKRMKLELHFFLNTEAVGSNCIRNKTND